MKFQTIILTMFGILAVVALGCLSACPTRNDGGDKTLTNAHGNVVIWGTFPTNEAVNKMIRDFNKNYQDIFSISYQFHDPKNFDSDIVEALASQKGPDILLLPDDLILRHSDKIDKYPYASLPQQVFKAEFVQAAEIYMREDGFFAIPFAIDPMVMYWNRDLFNNASLATPPKYWDEFLEITPKLTKRNPKTSELTQSALPFGEFANVTHAKDVLAMLFLQVGNPLVKGRPDTGFVSTVADNMGDSSTPDSGVVSALRFFMDFSNPKKANFTWSLARGNSLNEFIDGNLAVYFDFASQYNVIRDKNPHLNFGVAEVPLPRGASAEITMGKVYGLSVLTRSTNKETAYVAISKLLFDKDPARDFSLAYSLPPIKRSLLKEGSTDAAMGVFYDAALRSRTWLDPKPETSDVAFRKMVEAVSSGRMEVGESVARLNDDLNVALKNYK